MCVLVWEWRLKEATGSREVAVVVGVWMMSSASGYPIYYTCIARLRIGLGLGALNQYIRYNI